MHKLNRVRTLALFSILLLPSQLLQAGQPLNADQVRALFTGKTVEYHHEKLNMDFVVYHAPDGKLRGTRNGEPMSEMQWSVNSQGELCIAYKQHNRCRPIKQEDGVYKKYKTTGDGTTKILITYRQFTDGNPNNF